MKLRISAQETRRLFGASNRPDFETNVRHRAILRKALELFPTQELATIFDTPTKLRVAMGAASTFACLGTIKANYVRVVLVSCLQHYPLTDTRQMHDGRLVSRETPAPDLEGREALRVYRDAYDTYFKKKGNDYAVRNAHAKHVLQAAEQVWHDWVVRYLAARGRPGRPDWALQPLPGFERVRVTPATHPVPLPRAIAPASRAATSTMQTPSRRRPQLALPTPPPSSPFRSPAAASRVGSRMRPIELGNNHEDAGHLPRKRKFLGVIDISDSEAEEEEDTRPQKKMKSLGVIDISDSETEEDARPQKKTKFLGVIDLSN
ncbi:hypothetical protein DFH07DRAFT_784333 [Mycena maculata]|uniref:Uncharacterized protein n=1 Tax=Mycena maculata TaxID=230809 RepID=A0AAD7HH59_9AGAR|nr:hypothetical protein DFH07DRAFT_784333 [Mycena maculata]